ncbi:MAG TPA: FHA domain-containing protein, partial [Chloroflexota bacterium]|nr:FHA domain-containing protein [Chloroflexota bacterium]
MPGAFGTLVLTLPTGETRSYPLEKSVVTLGSAETNDIILHDPEVSRVHARVESDEAGCSIVDLESARGILINGIAAGRASLNPGDVVELGNSSLRFAGPIPIEVESDRTVVDMAAFERITAEAKAAREKQDAPQTTSGELPTPVHELASDTLVAIQPLGSKRPIFCVQAGHRDAITLARLAHFLGT